MPAPGHTAGARVCRRVSAGRPVAIAAHTCPSLMRARPEARRARTARSGLLDGEFHPLPGRRDVCHPLAWPWGRSVLVAEFQGANARLGGGARRGTRGTPRRAGDRSRPAWPSGRRAFRIGPLGSGSCSEHARTQPSCVELGRGSAGAGDLEAVFYGALVRRMRGCGAGGVVLARGPRPDDDEPVPRQPSPATWLDLHTPHSMAAGAPGRAARTRLARPARPGSPPSPGLPHGPLPHEAMAGALARSPPTSPLALGSVITCRTRSMTRHQCMTGAAGFPPARGDDPRRRRPAHPRLASSAR